MLHADLKHELLKGHSPTISALRPFALIDAGYEYARVPSRAAAAALVGGARALVAAVEAAISANPMRLCAAFPETSMADSRSREAAE